MRTRHAFPIAKNVLEKNVLERNFDVAKIGTPNREWAGDITYLATHEGWLYLAIVLDLGTRKAIGLSIGATMERSLVIDALRAAPFDRGSQYASGDYRALLDEFGIITGMSGKGEY